MNGVFFFLARIVSCATGAYILQVLSSPALTPRCLSATPGFTRLPSWGSSSFTFNHTRQPILRTTFHNCTTLVAVSIDSIGSLCPLPSYRLNPVFWEDEGLSGALLAT